jgi:acetamidase/formamidase
MHALTPSLRRARGDRFSGDEKKLSRDDAYMLVRVGVDFAMAQSVDGMKSVHAMIPKANSRAAGKR